MEIRTDAGVSGIGETYAGVFAPEVVRAIVEFHADRTWSAGTRARSDLLWQECRSRMLYWGRSGIAIATLSAIEAALWDVCGKLANKPVVELLGGACHASLPRYASGGMEADTGRLQAEATGVREAGYLAMKIRTGVSPEADRHKASIVLDALGPGVRLAVDAVQGTNPNPWSAAEAIAAGKALEDLGLLVVRGTVCRMGRRGLRGVSRSAGHPHRRGRELHHPRRGAGLPGHRRGRHPPARCGLARRALARPSAPASWPRTSRTDVAVHAWGSGGTVMSNYHAAFAMPNCRWLEYPSQPNPLIRCPDGRTAPGR